MLIYLQLDQLISQFLLKVRTKHYFLSIIQFKVTPNKSPSNLLKIIGRKHQYHLILYS